MRTLLVVLLGTLIAPWVLAQGPVAHWPMDEGQGNVTVDTVGGLQLKLEGAEWVRTKLGPALHFDGNDACATCELADALKPTERLTVSIWARRTGETRYQQLVDAGSGWGDDNQGYRLLLHYCGARFMQEAGGDACNLDGGDLVASQWYHVAVVYDGARAALYVNGRNAREVGDSGPITYDGLKTFRVGCGGNGGIIGDVDDLAIYDRALSADEIAALYEQSKGRVLSAEELMAAIIAGQETATLAAVPEAPWARDRHTCLLASFDSDESNDADYARRDARAAGGLHDADIPGHFGRGVRLENGQVPLIYAGASNCEVRSPEGRNIWADGRPAVMACVYCEDQVGFPDRPGFNLILRKLAEPNVIELAVDTESRYWLPPGRSSSCPAPTWTWTHGTTRSSPGTVATAGTPGC